MSRKKKNPVAVAYGKLAAGIPKTYSPEEIAIRTARCAMMSKLRWAKRNK